MFKVIGQGIYRLTESPQFGNQDVGITPGGAMDRFSFYTGNIMLKNPEDSKAYEIIYPPVFEAESDGCFVITGSKYSGSFLENDCSKIEIINNRVYQIKVGDTLHFGNKIDGFRSYLCFSSSKISIKNSGKERGKFSNIAHWHSKKGTIRVVKGPEYKFLNEPNNFFKAHWVITKDTSNMGMRLESDSILEVNMGNMISEAVSDGTVQITPKGPIILLRHRQTVGGYPRCFNVIQPDVDLLAQYMPGQILRFEFIEMDEAIRIAKTMNNDLNRLRDRFR